ncbi:hypothetical protein MTO96_013913 [Rhipicephalus appendiculatus]
MEQLEKVIFLAFSLRMAAVDMRPHAVPYARFLRVRDYFCTGLFILVRDGGCDRYFLSLKNVVAFDRSAVDFPKLVINNAHNHPGVVPLCIRQRTIRLYSL